MRTTSDFVSRPKCQPGRKTLPGLIVVNLVRAKLYRRLLDEMVFCATLRTHALSEFCLQNLYRRQRTCSFLGSDSTSRVRHWATPIGFGRMTESVFDSNTVLIAAEGADRSSADLADLKFGRQRQRE